MKVFRGSGKRRAFLDTDQTTPYMRGKKKSNCIQKNNLRNFSGRERIFRGEHVRYMEIERTGSFVIQLVGQ